MLRPRSIRFRLTLWYAVVLTGALGLFGSLVWVSMHQRLIADVDRDLADRVERFESYFKAELAEGGPEGAIRDELNEFCQALPPSSYLALHGDRGFIFRYPANSVRPAADVRTITKTFSADGETFQLEAVASLRDAGHALNVLRLMLWSLLPLVIAIACLGGWWLSGRALKPVKELTAAAHTISIENLSGRLPVPETGDELARLTLVLNGMLERLESAVKTLSQFAADASHELRTPLAVIRTTAELAVRRDRSTESYRASLQEIVAEAQRMTTLIEDMLILARSDTGTAEMPREVVSIDRLIEHVCAEMRGLAELRQVHLSVVKTASASISGNPAALHRLFLVLLDNAIKYSRSAGEVIVTMRVDDRVVVTVEDFGAGIAPEALPHIFKRFYRGDPARSSGGHGLGLALADSIARAHGATIDVESTEGAGSRFQVSFPVRAATDSENLQVARIH